MQKLVALLEVAKILMQRRYNTNEYTAPQNIAEYIVHKILRLFY